MIGKVMAAILAAFIAVLLATPAEACTQDNNGRTVCLGPAVAVGLSNQFHQSRFSPAKQARYEEGRVVSHPAGCPYSAFCGCGVSVRLYGHPVRALYPAAAYGKFPTCTASSGAVAYRAHHVFYIESTNGDGTVLAYDPNSGGHLTRVHNVSLRGYRVVCPGSGRYASR